MPKTVLQNLLIAVAYVAAGLPAILLIIPPSPTSPIWPAAGIALGAALVFGYRIIPGVVLGSLLVNLIAGGLPSTFAAIALALGVGLQTAIGLALCRLVLLHKSPLDTGRDILKLFLIGGGVAGAVNALIGFCNLNLLGLSQPSQFLTTTLTWWIGDLAGVLIFTPLTLIVVGLPRDLWRPRFVPVGVPLIIAFCISVFLYVLATRWEEDKRRTAFNSRTEGHKADLERYITSYEEVVRNLRNLFLASEEVEPDEFRVFTDATLRNYPAIQALQWCPVVPHSDRAQFEAGVREGAFPYYRIREETDGTLVPAAERPVYYPVLFVEPVMENENVVGFDLGSEQSRLAAIAAAEQGAEVVATDPINLVQEGDDSLGLLLFSPVVKHDQLQGLVLGTFRVREILGNLKINLAKAGITISARDAGMPDGEGYLFGTPGANPENLVSTQKLGIANRTWELTFVQGAVYRRANQSWQSWSLFSAGVLVNAFLVGFLLVLNGRTARVEHLVEKRTVDLEAARREAMKSAEVKAAFLANMSHEIRTPMNGIVGMINLAAAEDLSPEVARMLRTAKSSADSLIVIINDILDFSQLEAGEILLEKEPFSVRTLAENIRNLFEPQAREKDLTLQIAFGAGIPAWVDGDATRIGQVLANLTSNALKFTEQGGVLIDVRLEDHEGAWLTKFSVRDTGIGLAPEDVDKLFIPFSQVDGSAARRVGGTGLGLAICRRIVKQMGGELSVESKKGRGSTFSFALSLPGSLSPPPDDEPAFPPGAELGSQYPLRILLAEDSNVNQVIAKSFLKKLGYVADVAANGLEAIALTESKTYDLILMDMQMPEMDGVAATVELRKRYPKSQLRIVALTANVMIQHRAECEEAGMDGFLPKPLAIGPLQRILEETIHWKKHPSATPTATVQPSAP